MPAQNRYAAAKRRSGSRADLSDYLQPPGSDYEPQLQARKERWGFKQKITAIFCLSCSR